MDKRTDGETYGRRETSIPPFQLRWSGVYNDSYFKKDHNTTNRNRCIPNKQKNSMPEVVPYTHRTGTWSHKARYDFYTFALVLTHYQYFFLTRNHYTKCQTRSSNISQNFSTWSGTPLWPSDAIWWHRSGSTLVQLMACCLMAPNH